MVGRNYILSIIFIIIIFLGNAQEAVLCSLQSSSLKIENTTDIPTVSTNTDGTINLTFAQQDLTDLFSNYMIYDFYQAFPNSSSEEVLKYHTISYNSKALVEDILTNIPTSTIEISSLGNDIYALPMKTSISTELIEILDGNSYDVTKLTTTADSHPCNEDPNCELDDVPDNFNFRVQFNYDAETELMTMKSESLTSCGNAFSIALTGGNPNEFGEIDNTFQTWESTAGTSAVSESSESCYFTEGTIFGTLGIGCPSFNYTYGNISVTLNSENELLRFRKSNMVFGFNIIEFTKSSLSIKEENFKKIKPYKIQGNPYLHISNLNNQSISVSIYNTSGQQIINTKTFKENTIDISKFQTGLYFIRLSDLNNQQKIFKFLQN